MRRSLAIGLGLALTAESPAWADGYVRSAPTPRFETAPLATPPIASRDAAPGSHWYGGQLLAVDGIVVTLGAITASTKPIFTVLAALGYFAGGPMIHGAHDRGWIALGSFGLRTLGPIVGAMVGTALSDPREPFACVDACVAGLVAGYIGTVVIDAAALSWESAPRAPHSVAQQFVVPTAAFNRDSGIVGIQAIF